MTIDKIVKSTCRLCYNSCGILIDIKNGIPVAIRGDKDQSMSRGHLCTKGMAALEILNHPSRLTSPLLKTYSASESHWHPIGWDEALDRVAQGLNQVKEKYGARSVVFARGGSKGMADDHLARFANLFGSPNITGAAYICYSPCLLASKHTYGFLAYPDLTYPPRSVVLWGFNPKDTHPPVYRELKMAQKNGAKIILIDPAANPSAKNPFCWLKPCPGKDLSLALGILKVIIEEQLYDKIFVEKWTIGFSRLKSHVASFSLEKIQEQTWVDKTLIRKVAKHICLEKPGCILWGNALEATKDSYQACRAISMIRALSGNLGLPGTDIQWSKRGELRRRSPEFLLTDRITPQDRNHRLGTKAGLLPDFGFVPHHLAVKAMLESDPYPVRGAYLQNANMIIANEDAVKTEAALKSLDFCVATEMFMTPTAALADIILPSASFLEFDSVEQPWHSSTAVVQQKVASLGQTKSDGQTLNALARRMGFDPVWKNHEACLDFYLEPAGIRFSEFRKMGELSGPPCYREHEKKGFPTSTGKIELYSDFLDGLGFDPLPKIDDKNHVSAGNKFPLVLTSRKSRHFCHSSGRQIPSLRNRCPHPVVWIHPGTAKKYAIKAGDEVFIRTAKGKIRQTAFLTEDIDTRVVVAEHGWWFPEHGLSSKFGSRQSNLNLLTDGDCRTNKEIGSSSLRGIFCAIEKADPTQGV